MGKDSLSSQISRIFLANHIRNPLFVQPCCFFSEWFGKLAVSVIESSLVSKNGNLVRVSSHKEEMFGGVIR